MPDPKPVRRTVIDPAVAELLTGLERQRSEAALPRKEREKKARERAKIQARREARATYDLPPALREKIRLLAEEQRVPASQIVTLALARFLDDLGCGKVDLGNYKCPSRSPRYDWNLEFPPELIDYSSPRKKGQRRS
ncbi:MAG: hypothetical protein WC837_13330 [Bellilinea sp.]